MMTNRARHPGWIFTLAAALAPRLAEAAPLVALALAFLSTAGAIVPASSAAPSPWTRVANDTLRLPRSLEAPGYRLVEAFPGLATDAVVAITSPPGETNRLFLVEKYGRIVVITNLAAPTRTVFLDLTDRVESGGEAGLLGLAFHPDYRRNGRFFVFYTLNTTSQNPDGSRHNGLHDRISRFEADPDPDPARAHRALPGSEHVLISQFDRASNHNGGDIHFGPDGYLYVSLGDEGGGGDNYGNSQRIDVNFFSGILRLDVDQRPGSLAPNPHPAVVGNYRVPPDNPFVGASSFNGLPLDPALVRTEFWAVGLRNPWRFSFDPVSGDLLCGDVGQGAREEVNRIVRGGNYGWNYREGTLPYAGPPPPGFIPLPPLVEYGRPGFTPDTLRQGFSVIGGLVYHGSRLPELSGSYLFGDWGSGFLWAVRREGDTVRSFDRLLAGPGMTCFGRDPRNGDLLVGTAPLQRLVHSEETQPPPDTLADTGVFADTAALAPAPGVVPYEINVPFWSDHARKRRWFTIPSVTDTITFRAGEPWSFPTGTVWVKHFDLELVRGDPASARRVETRLLVRTDTGVYGLSYRWDGSSDNARLVPADGLDEEFTIEDAGTSRRQVWHFPSRNECLACHTPAGGFALGFSTAQLNRTTTVHGTPVHQLEALAAAGYFNRALPAVASLPRLAAPGDTTATVEHRVRSYLEANCAQCHQQDGPTTGRWDARSSVATARAGLINGLLNDNGGNPEARVIRPGSLANSMLYQRIVRRGPGQMPPLGSSIVDAENAALVAFWITNTLASSSGSPITLTIDGSGAVKGVIDQQLLVAGKRLTVRAVPQAGHLFSHWSGSVLTNANPLPFVMQPGFHLEAHFVTNRFLALQGQYFGLALNQSSNASPDRSGSVSATIQPSGAFSARFQLGRERLSVSERFAPNGTAFCAIPAPGGRFYIFQLTLAPAAPGSVPLTGFLASTETSARLEAIQAAPTPARRFTWATTQDLTAADHDVGEGFGTLRTSATGLATMAGRLPDGTPFTHSTALAADGLMPLAVLVHLRRDSHSWLGWAQHNAGLGQFWGAATWVASAGTELSDPQPLPWSGSAYSADLGPPDGASVTVVARDGPLAAPLTNTVTLRAGRGTTSAIPATSLRLQPGTGLFSGSITDPATGRTHAFQGAIVPAEGEGRGLLAGPPHSGLVELRWTF